MKQRWLLTLGLLATLLTSCSLDDDRDECCYQVRLYYHETVDGIDLYEQDVKSIRHLLYDSLGTFIREVFADYRTPQTVDIGDLDNGTYTVISVANATEKTLFEKMEDLSQFELVLNSQSTGTRSGSDIYDNADELYWSKVTFHINNTAQEIDCPLSNIHCHLHVRAEWKGVPKQVGRWTMRLFDVNMGYLAGSAGLTIREREFPTHTGYFADHMVVSSVFNFELECEFITFRWTNERLPILQIWCDDEPVTKMMDLEIAFQEWGWFPDRAQIQDYWIDLVISEDGSVEMRPGGSIGIHDWVDGGSISN